MSTPASSKKSTSLSLIGKSFSFIFNLIILALLAWMLLLLFAAINIFLSGWQITWQIFASALLGMSSHLWVTQLSFTDFIQKFDNGSQLPASIAWVFPSDSVFLNKFIHESANVWITLLFVTQFVVERCQVFIFGSVVILAFSLLGFVDGLVQRDIRKFQNARESTLIFHRSKSLLLSLVYTGYFLLIVTPLSINLTFCLMLLACLVGYLIQLSTKQFKKHL